MWFKIIFEEGKNTAPENPYTYTIAVEILNQRIAPVDDSSNTFRLSPIFPLRKDSPVPNITNCHIHFFNFRNAYRALGRLDKIAGDDLKSNVFFSTGLCSIILICSDDDELRKFKKIVEVEPSGSEHWVIANSRVETFSYEIDKSSAIIPINMVDYDSLPLNERALIDEFKVTIKLLLLKLTTHMPFELEKIQRLIEEVNNLLIELIYLNNPIGTPPATLSEYTEEDLKGKKVNQAINHQNVDRIIQINSALSYVSTQAFSGAIPILERRSLIRRNSFLGIGAAILALNNISRTIENSFSGVSIDKTITEQFANAAPLSGLDQLPKYDSENWSSESINRYQPSARTQNYLKLPYFSGRLGFREAEYSIAAAIQSISSGASLEWSLMTITHEMLHGHVRTIINSIFFGDENSASETLRSSFYSKFREMYLHRSTNDKLIDSIRSVIFSYCTMTMEYGSLTMRAEYKGDVYKVPLPDSLVLWKILAQENRNIHEIFVHVLDLNYFYANRLSLYIPLIWRSWISVPHINGDVRQYILRSLLTIASKSNLGVIHRFNWAVEILEELLTKYSTSQLNFPVIHEVIEILKDRKELKEYYLPAFKSSLMLVDLVNEVFVSERLRGELFDDQYVKWDNSDEEEDSFEQKFEYQIPGYFNDEIISAPVAYLLDRMAKILDKAEENDEIERETAILFLALNSN
jgi:hypothetical protein